MAPSVRYVQLCPLIHESATLEQIRDFLNKKYTNNATRNIDRAIRTSVGVHMDHDQRKKALQERLRSKLRARQQEPHPSPPLLGRK